MLKGLKAIIIERFHPAQYLPMILLFTLANTFYFQFSGLSTVNNNLLVLTGLIMLSAFFRLRLFDEIKDYETDLKVNPTRPLARGAISIAETRTIIFLFILFEIILCSFLGLAAVLIHAFTILYSLLMFEEFFIGKFLRPHLTTYAVTHTFISTLLGVSAACLATGLQITSLPSNVLLFFLMNWCYFNLFEFARKTFSQDEERPNVDSYSSLFKPFGAGLLSLSQVILGLALLTYLLADSQLLIIAGLMYSVFCFFYMIKPTAGSAKLFRNITGVYLLAHYALLAWIFWR